MSNFNWMDDSTIPGSTPTEKARWLCSAAYEELEEGNNIEIHLDAIRRQLDKSAFDYDPNNLHGTSILPTIEHITGPVPAPTYRVEHTATDAEGNSITTIVEVHDPDASGAAVGTALRMMGELE